MYLYVTVSIIETDVSNYLWNNTVETIKTMLKEYIINVLHI